MDEILAFLAQNDGEKWFRKNIFEIPPCASHLPMDFYFNRSP